MPFWTLCLHLSDICPELVTYLLNWFRSKGRRTRKWDPGKTLWEVSPQWSSYFLTKQKKKKINRYFYAFKFSKVKLTLKWSFISIYKFRIFFLVSLINAIWTLVSHLIIDCSHNVYRDNPAHSKCSFMGCWYLESTLRSVFHWPFKSC